MRFEITDLPECYQKQIIQKTAKQRVKSEIVKNPCVDIDKPERELQKEVNAYLRALKDRQEIMDYFHMEKAKGNKIGLPDVLVFLRNSKIIFIELKTAKGKLTKEQKEFEKRCKQFESKFFVCRNIQSVIEVLKQHKK